MQRCMSGKTRLLQAGDEIFRRTKRQAAIAVMFVAVLGSRAL